MGKAWGCECNSLRELASLHLLGVGAIRPDVNEINCRNTQTLGVYPCHFGDYRITRSRYNQARCPKHVDFGRLPLSLQRDY
jgi:hypothetical protein